MRSIFAYLLLVISPALYADDILFLDLDGSLNELRACQQGATAANPDDEVEEIEHEVNAKTVRAAIRGYALEGRKFDTIIISGHDGSGEFYGANENRFSAADLQSIMREQPAFAANVTSVALWGCYSTPTHECETDWLRQVGPNVKLAAGFTREAPTAAQQGNGQLLREFCQKRSLGVNAQSQDEFCSFFDGLSRASNFSIGVCTQTGLATRRGKSCIDSYENLHRRCDKYLSDPKYSVAARTAMYGKFLAATEPGFAEPPPDDNNSTLSKYYNDIHEWYHCQRDAKTKMGIDLPDPLQILRLTAFSDFRKNFAAAESAEIQQYNDYLRRMGLGQFALEHVEAMKRGDIVARTMGAVSALSQMNRPVNGVDPKKLLVMAAGFDRTIRQLDVSCSPPSWVNVSSLPSPCIAAYGERPRL